MIKVASPAQRHPTHRSLADFQRYWGESHGPLFSNTRLLRRYVQHLTIPEAYGIAPAPTFDGVSMFWFDDVAARRNRGREPEVVELSRAVRDDDRQLFDRIPSWPTHHKRASVVAEEKVVLDGTTSPEMVKAVIIVARHPGLSLNEFFEHWTNEHGPLASKLPGLRRYVQNHAVLEAYLGGEQSHDGWSEFWFDDLESLHAAARSPEWKAMEDDGVTLFGENSGVVVAREKIQKDLNWTYNDWGVRAQSEDEVRARLEREGFGAIVDKAGAIKQAAEHEALAVFTSEHIVTIDESRIDARPAR